MADPPPVMIFGELLMFVQVVVTVVTFMHVRQHIYDTWRVAHIRSRLVFRDSMRRLTLHSAVRRPSPCGRAGGDV